MARGQVWILLAILQVISTLPLGQDVSNGLEGVKSATIEAVAKTVSAAVEAKQEVFEEVADVAAAGLKGLTAVTGSAVAAVKAKLDVIEGVLNKGVLDVANAGVEGLGNVVAGVADTLPEAKQDVLNGLVDFGTAGVQAVFAAVDNKLAVLEGAIDYTN